MDTSDYPSVPNLQQLHARLAANSRRVEAVIDSQLDSFERLFTATTAQDWRAVAEASRRLAEAAPKQVGLDVIRRARLVCDELRHASDAADEMKQPKHLAGLLDACRVARQRSRRSH